MNRPRLPLALKVAYTAWLVMWMAGYWVMLGPSNFLWLCDLANLLVGLALWLESPLLFSAQAVSILLVDLAWTIDVTAALLTGKHPIGGTQYMFIAAEPLWLRLMSLFHVAVPVLVLWCLLRLGFDRRGWRLQTAIAWVLLPVCFFFTDPALNLNWLRRPFEMEQTLMPPLAYLGFCLIAYPLVLFWPTGAVLGRMLSARSR